MECVTDFMPFSLVRIEAILEFIQRTVCQDDKVSFLLLSNGCLGCQVQQILHGEGCKADTIVAWASALLVQLVVNSVSYKTTHCIDINPKVNLTKSSAQKLNLQENRAQTFFTLGRTSGRKCDRTNQN